MSMKSITTISKVANGLNPLSDVLSNWLVPADGKYFFRIQFTDIYAAKTVFPTYTYYLAVGSSESGTKWDYIIPIKDDSQVSWISRAHNVGEIEVITDNYNLFAGQYVSLIFKSDQANDNGIVNTCQSDVIIYAGDNISYADGEDISTSVEIETAVNNALDTQIPIDPTDGSVNDWIKNSQILGAGSITHAYTVTETDNVTPIEGVKVWVSTDIAGANLVAGFGMTDIAGNVEFRLEAGWYYFWSYKLGRTFTNPDYEEVV